MLLFFFMVATTSKESDPKVSLKQPEGVRTEDMTPYKQRSEIDFLYLGKPRNTARLAQFPSGYALFLDNVAQPSPGELYNATAVRQWKLDKYEAKPKSAKSSIGNIFTCIKADKGAPVGIIFDIRSELQDIEALKIAYAVQDNSNN